MRSLIEKQAPRFDTTVVVSGHEIAQNFSLSQYKGKKYVVFFPYPMDFTFICPTGLHAFQEKLDEFEKRNVAVVGYSVDSEYSHLSWLQIPKSEEDIRGMKYPIVSNFSKSISESYGVLAGNCAPDEDGNWVCKGAPVALRGLSLIDKKGVVRHCVTDGLPLGRNVDEVPRIMDALQHFGGYGEACPANWSKGKDAMETAEDGVASYLSRHQ